MNLKATQGAGFRLFLGATMISFSAVFVRMTDVGPTVTGFYRMFFGSLLLFPIGWLWALKQPPKELLNPNRKFWTIVAGCFIAFDLIVWHRCIHYVGPGLATILANFQVFFLAAFGIIALNENPSWKVLMGIPGSILGLFMLIDRDWNKLGTTYQLGVGLGLLTALCYAVYLLALRQAQSQKDASLIGNMALVSLIATGVLALAGWSQQESFVIPDGKNLLILLAYALLTQLGWMLITHTLPQLEASRAGLLLSLQPALTFLWDILFFDLPTSWVQGIGAILTFTAIYLGSSAKR